MIMMDAPTQQDDVNQRQHQQQGDHHHHRTSDGRHNPYGPCVLCTATPTWPSKCAPTATGGTSGTETSQAASLGERHIVSPHDDQASTATEPHVDGNGAARTPVQDANCFQPLAAAANQLPPPSYQQHRSHHHPREPHQSFAPSSGSLTSTPSYMSTFSPLSMDSTTASMGHGSMHASALAHHCTLLQIPLGFESVVAEDVAALSAMCQQTTTGVPMPQPLFVGQCRFELTAGELQWLLHSLTGVRALKVEPRGPGCFVVVVGDEASAEQLLGLHRCILFDYHGVWWAKTDAARSVLEAHVAGFSPQHTRRSRLPRDAMIVERQRGSLNPLRSIASERRPSTNALYAANRASCEPQQHQRYPRGGGDGVLQMPRFRPMETGGFTTPSIMTSPLRGQQGSLESSKLSNESFGI